MKVKIWVATFRVGIILGGNFPGEYFPGGNFPGGSIPGGNFRVEVFRVGIILGGNFPGGSFPEPAHVPIGQMLIAPGYSRFLFAFPLFLRLFVLNC